VEIGARVELIGERAFYNSTNITNISVSGLNSAYKSIEGALFTYDGETIIQYNSGNFYSFSSLPEGVTTIAPYAFMSANYLTYFTIGKDVVTIGEGAFYGCMNMDWLKMEDGATAIGKDAFRACVSLETIEITASVTEIGMDAFASCRVLRWAKCPANVVPHLPEDTLIEVQITSGEIAENALKNRTSLKIVTLDEGITAIGKDAFYGCTALVSISFTGTQEQWDAIEKDENWNRGVPADMQFIFLQTAMEGTAGVEYDVSNDGTYATAIQYTGTATEVTFASTYKGLPVTKIRSSVFEENTYITSVVISENVTMIDGTTFSGCKGLTNISVVENNAIYKSIEGNLYTKDETTLVKYAIGKTETTFTIPDSVTTIGANACSNCQNITSIVVPDSVVIIGPGAFGSNSRLTSVVLGERVASIGDSAFEECESLTSVIIPDSVTSIGEYVFSSCCNLSSVVLGDGLLTIGERAFTYCESLTSVEIPNSVTMIEECAFEDCESLTSITFLGTVEQWKAIVKEDDWNYDVPATKVVCSDGEVAL
jgi:hypothetical protein